MPDIYQKAAEKIEDIIKEMRAEGMWQSEPLPEDAYDFSAAFGADKLAFEQWIQFILVPRVDEIIKEKGTFPSGSMVGTYAIREFDGLEKASYLITLLCEFDALFGPAE